LGFGFIANAFATNVQGSSSAHTLVNSCQKEFQLNKTKFVQICRCHAVNVAKCSKTHSHTHWQSDRHEHACTL